MVPSGRLTQRSGVDGELKGMRIEVAGSPSMKYRAIKLPAGCQRAAKVTVAFAPSRSGLQQPLICRRSIFVPAAIAEHPGAEVGCIFFLGPQLEGDARACDRMLTPPLVQHGFTEAAKENRESILGEFASRQIKVAGLHEVGGGAQRSRAGHRLFQNFIEVGHCAMLSEKGPPVTNSKN
jgi:hypothetical protein